MAPSNTIKMPSRFDYSKIQEFNAAFAKLSEPGETVYLDCDQLEYIDSAGIGILVMAQKKAKAQSVVLIIKNIKGAVKEILELANLQKIIDFQ